MINDKEALNNYIYQLEEKIKSLKNNYGGGGSVNNDVINN